jgi:hypothetical protein
VTINKGVGDVLNISNQPAQLLTVVSPTLDAFSYAAEESDQVVYDLTPYQLVEVANGTAANELTKTGNLIMPLSVVIKSNNLDGNIITPASPVTVTVRGYGATQQQVLETAVFSSLSSGASNSLALSVPLFNVTDIYLSRAVPDVTVTVEAGTAANTLASLKSINPQILYALPGNSISPIYYNTSAASVPYNQQTGEPATYFNLTVDSVSAAHGAKKYFNYVVNENPVPINTLAKDSLAFGIYNSSLGVGSAPYFQLNYSLTGAPNNMSYTNTNGVTKNVAVGFVTQRGSVFAYESAEKAIINLFK